MKTLAEILNAAKDGKITGTREINKVLRNECTFGYNHVNPNGESYLYYAGRTYGVDWEIKVVQ